MVVLVAPVPTTSSCKALQVLHPTIPSIANPLLLWYAFTAFCVAGPNIPSNPFVLYPNVFKSSCAIKT